MHQLQLYLTLCNPMNHSLPGSSVHGILQARILVWVALPFSRGIFPSQGSNPSLRSHLHWQVGSLPLVLLGSPGLLHWQVDSLSLYHLGSPRDKHI